MYVKCWCLEATQQMLTLGLLLLLLIGFVLAWGELRLPLRRSCRSLVLLRSRPGQDSLHTATSEANRDALPSCTQLPDLSFTVHQIGQ